MGPPQSEAARAARSTRATRTVARVFQGTARRLAACPAACAAACLPTRQGAPDALDEVRNLERFPHPVVGLAPGEGTWALDGSGDQHRRADHAALAQVREQLVAAT